MACSHTTTCPLFPLISVNSALKVWKTFYCEGKYDNCARYQLSHSGKSVPANLLPNGKSLTTAGMSSVDSAEPNQTADAVEQAAPKIVEEMASIDLGELDLDIESLGTRPSTSAPASAPVTPAPTTSAAAPASTTSAAQSAVNGATSSWYLRILANTDTGVVGNVIQGLGSHRIKIDAMAEKRQSGAEVKIVLIVITDQTSEDTLNTALSELQALPTIVGPVKRIKLEHLSADMFS